MLKDFLYDKAIVKWTNDDKVIFIKSFFPFVFVRMHVTCISLYIFCYFSLTKKNFHDTVNYHYIYACMYIVCKKCVAEL